MSNLDTITITEPCVERGRDRILRVAHRRFADRGYADASMQDIADDVGMSKAALYYHFRDKQELFLEIFAAEWKHLNTILENSMDANLSLADSLYGIALRILESGRGELRQFFVDFQNHVLQERRQDFVANMRQPADIIQPAIQAAVERGDIRPELDIDVVIRLYFTMIFGQIRRLNALGLTGGGASTTSNEHLARTITDLTLHGISAHRKQSR